jgi:murein DD-endopeptidase MepM/ murein hydrolase activator NlpD
VLAEIRKITLMNCFLSPKRFAVFSLIAVIAISFACRKGTTDPNDSNVAVLYRETPTPSPTESPSPLTEVPPAPTDLATPSPSSEVLPSPSQTPPPLQPEPTPQTNTSAIVIPSQSLIIPVAGIQSKDLRDTFNDARSEGRVHNAIDIMAPRGALVVAATDGKLVKFFDSEKGGITIYQMGTDQKTIYYYGHLDRRAENLREGDFVKQGTLLGYVGDTGNSGAGNYHLHFSIWTVDDPKRYWEGTNINPYPLLKQAGK